MAGRLVRRWQTDAGRWVYTVALRASSSRTASTGQDISADMVELDVPADRVRPVPGTSYEGVPKLHRLPPTTPLAVPIPPEHTPAAAADSGRWLGERVQAGADLKIRLHQPACEAIAGNTGGTLTTDEARWMIANEPIASACDACTARRTLVG
ncbi:hypothetical protein ACFYYB_40780 [Streptomyces sp. NPDC002886]|uniref:hypothetical protein n=1 Tax=Streptomyces sp. NPDC002886 TaxID=3364667 RepID=UPI00368AB082